MSLYFVLFIKREKEQNRNQQDISPFDERQSNDESGQIPQDPTKYKESGVRICF